MEHIMKRTKVVMLILIPIFIIINFFLVEVLKTNTEIFNLIVYTVTYIMIGTEIFLLNECKILSGPVFATLMFTVSIGLGPVAYYLFFGKTCETQYIIILISIASFLVGDILYKIIKSKNSNVKKIQQIKEKKEKNYKVLELILWVMLVVSLIASAYYLYINSDVLANGNYDNNRISAMKGNGILIQAIGLSKIALCMMFELLLEKKISKKKFIVFIILTIPTTLVVGFRSTLIAPILIMMIMYNRKNKILTRRVIITVLIAVVMIVSLGVIRQILSNGLTKWYQSFLLLFANGSINVNAILDTFPKTVEYQNGYTYLINIIMLRPGPDLDFTLWLKEQVGYSFSGGGMTPTMIGEIYINFGKILIPIIFCALGLIVNKVEEMYKRSFESYYPSYCLYIICGMVGSGFCVSEVPFLITTAVYICVYILSTSKILKWRIFDGK